MEFKWSNTPAHKYCPMLFIFNTKELYIPELDNNISFGDESKSALPPDKVPANKILEFLNDKWNPCVSPSPKIPLAHINPAFGFHFAIYA